LAKDATADYSEGFMHAALVTSHANHASAIVATREVTGLFWVTVRSHRTRPPWSIPMDESH